MGQVTIDDKSGRPRGCNARVCDWAHPARVTPIQFRTQLAHGEGRCEFINWSNPKTLFPSGAQPCWAEHIPVLFPLNCNVPKVSGQTTEDAHSVPCHWLSKLERCDWRLNWNLIKEGEKGMWRKGSVSATAHVHVQSASDLPTTFTSIPPTTSWLCRLAVHYEIAQKIISHLSKSKVVTEIYKTGAEMKQILKRIKIVFFPFFSKIVKVHSFKFLKKNE